MRGVVCDGDEDEPPETVEGIVTKVHRAGGVLVRTSDGSRRLAGASCTVLERKADR